MMRDEAGVANGGQVLLFWNKKHGQQVQMAIQSAVESLSDQVRGAQQALSGQADAVLEQLNKLGRLQYKNGHESAERLQKLLAAVEELAREKSEAQQLRQQLVALEQRVERLWTGTIRWVDELDALRDGLEGAEREVWSPLLGQWTERLLAQLTEAGVREIPVLGTGFDPRWSEAVGAVEPELAPAAQPYEVVKVVRRGFAKDNGSVLRKAQVITVKGENVGD